MTDQLTGTTTVEMDPISGELFITFPDDIAQAVGMDDWEWVNWDLQDDGTVVLTKVDDWEWVNWDLQDDGAVVLTKGNGPDEEVAQGSSEEP